ncbi:MAG: pyridoxal phosphate-dependent aminotransferase family protein [Thermoanaerobaculia bacterium]|nr:pyridoxal phosphate-dependent aminotransferase family protein [Thermoanaerobaculia bacterium]
MRPRETDTANGYTEFLGEPEGSENSGRVLPFPRSAPGDLFEKCRRFRKVVEDLKRRQLYQAQYRVTLEGPLDHRIRVRNPFSGLVEEMVCFDSNSYLGLHLHPKVISAVAAALVDFGYGTPSAQLLGGTNRFLRTLEETVAGFHGREDALIFPSGYGANIGTLTALLSRGDFVARDRFSHASLQDGCRWSGARFGGTYQHRDTTDLDRLFRREAGGACSRLVVTDGVFSMHGRIAPLRSLRETADRHGARLLVDDAHGLGVLGATGRGIEEHFGLPGAADVLTGTFSKASGSVGGYVCGSADLIEYLRVFARSSMFTASLPAAICAGVTESFRVMSEEPEHRERVWSNARRLWEGLRQVGLLLPELESPILPLFMGHERLLWSASRDLFLAGFKCGNVGFPAVPRGECIIRLTVSSRHTDDDLDRAVEALAVIGRRYGILGRCREEIQAIGRSLPADGRFS